jgi:OOP family OmpA-OmpF porin
LAAELEYAYLAKQDIDETNLDGDFKAQNVMLNLIARYSAGMLHPYVGIGAGWSWGKFKAGTVPPVDESDDSFAWQAMAGVNFDIAPNWSADVGYRYIQSKYDVAEQVEAKSRNHLIMLGLNYHFGAAKPVAAPAPPPQAEMAPPPPPVEAKVVPPPAVVMDSDGDGVPDDLDKCPDTPKGAIVDKDGCPQWVSIRLNVEFDFDRAVVKDQYYDEIRKVAEFMSAHKNLKGAIEGHTDSIGTEEYNLALSQRRAEAVRKILCEKYNVPTDSLTIKGYGESKPIADNNTREGRQQNRRVEAVLKAMKVEK